MKRFLLYSIGLLVLLGTSTVSAQERPGADIEGRRLAQTGMKFLSVSVDPRAAALGDAVTASIRSPNALFYNPAGMAEVDGGVNVALNHVQWFGNFEYNAGTAAYRPAGGAFGVFGVSVLVASYGEVVETIRADNERGYQDLGTFSPSAMAVGFGYARSLTDRFSFGAHLKYARQDLGTSLVRYSASGDPVSRGHAKGTIAGDFGVLYHTGFRSLSFALGLRNFSRELTYAEESFELPLTFNIGVSMDLLDFAAQPSDMHSFYLTADAQRPRDYAEQVRIGGEYVFMDMLSLRGGYVFPSDEQGLNVGVGLNLSVGGLGLGASFAHTQFGRLGDISRLGLEVSM